MIPTDLICVILFQSVIDERNYTGMTRWLGLLFAGYSPVFILQCATALLSMLRLPTFLMYIGKGDPEETMETKGIQLNKTSYMYSLILNISV